MTPSAPPALAGISILGAGWLGEPLAQALVAAGHPVRVSTTRPARQAALAAAGLRAHCLTLDAPSPEQPDPAPAAEWRAFLAGSTALVVSVPPGQRAAADPVAAAALYQARLQRLGALLAGTGIRHVVLLSSTAVYPDLPGAPELAEAAADPTHPLAQAEAALAAALPAGVTLTLARLAGLMGPGRAPGRFFGPTRPVSQPAAPVNMVHLTDAIGAIRALLATPGVTGAVAVCAAQHPARSVFYTAAARALGLPPPPLAVEPIGAVVVGKRVSSARLRALTGYRFRYDDPLAGILNCEM